MEIIQQNDLQYPQLLKEIQKAPKILYAMGDISILNNKAVTVIGSRNMTEYGKENTKRIVKDLVKAGLTIVSGMAVGIDRVAHETCLENNGKTIAVLGCGLNKIFPPENKDLFKKIIEKGGCVLSEYPVDTVAEKNFFVERNRIVSGLSDATLVIEATYRSGTSITANYALNQGRKLFCIPNSIGNKNSAGIINWLKKGAKLVTNADEILQELGLKKQEYDADTLSYSQKIREMELIERGELEDQEEVVKNIYYYIKEHGVTNAEILSLEFNTKINYINAYLIRLELKGLIINTNGLNYKVSDNFYA